MYSKAIIYCRVSTHDQSCERQERDLLAFAARANYEVVGIYKETASGARIDRQERKKVLALAQRREINAILVTELTRWGRSVSDLTDTLNALHSWNVSLIAETGFQCDLSTPQGRLVANIMCALAEFERDLTRERIRSGVATARAKGRRLGKPPGLTERVKRLTPKVISSRSEGRSIRWIARDLQISTRTVQDILARYKG